MLSGSNLAKPLELVAGLQVARLERRRKGARNPSKLLQALSFGSYAKRFKPIRTPFDWLSREVSQVDYYVADPLCGFSISTQLWVDIFNGLRDISAPSHFAQFPKSLPILILGGSRDPVGGAKGMARLASAYRQAGVIDVELTVYPDGRHEMFNDIVAEQVTDDLVAWLNLR